MYSPELMKFLLDYKKEPKQETKKYYNFKDGNAKLTNKLATVHVTVSNK